MEPRESIITITGTPYRKELYEVAPEMYEVLKLAKKLSTYGAMGDAGYEKCIEIQDEIDEVLRKAQGN